MRCGGAYSCLVFMRKSLGSLVLINATNFNTLNTKERQEKEAYYYDMHVCVVLVSPEVVWPKEMATLCHNIKLKVGQTLQKHCPKPFPWSIVTNATNYVPCIFIHYACISWWRKFHIKVSNCTCNFVLLMLNARWRIMLFNIKNSKLHFAQWLSHCIN